jgi:hypothetical protein
VRGILSFCRGRIHYKAGRGDIVNMKEQRNSDQDKVDIGRLRDDKDRKDDS